MSCMRMSCMFSFSFLACSLVWGMAFRAMVTMSIFLSVLVRVFWKCMCQVCRACLYCMFWRACVRACVFRWQRESLCAVLGSEGEGDTIRTALRAVLGIQTASVFQSMIDQKQRA